MNNVDEYYNQNVLYVHGYKSNFDRESIKIKTLEDLGNTVYGIDINYDNESLDSIIERAKSIIKEASIDYVVGTSLGGYICSRLDIPYISLNPALDIEGCPPFKSTNEDNLILLNKGDELFDSLESFKTLNNLNTSPMLINDGDHRFSNINKSAVLAIIKDFDSNIYMKNHNISEGIDNY